MPLSNDWTQDTISVLTSSQTPKLPGRKEWWRMLIGSQSSKERPVLLETVATLRHDLQGQLNDPPSKTVVAKFSRDEIVTGPSLSSTSVSGAKHATPPHLLFEVKGFANEESYKIVLNGAAGSANSTFESRTSFGPHHGPDDFSRGGTPQALGSGQLGETPLNALNRVSSTAITAHQARQSAVVAFLKGPSHRRYSLKQVNPALLKHPDLLVLASKSILFELHWLQNIPAHRHVMPLRACAEGGDKIDALVDGLVDGLERVYFVSDRVVETLAQRLESWRNLDNIVLEQEMKFANSWAYQASWGGNSVLDASWAQRSFPHATHISRTKVNVDDPLFRKRVLYCSQIASALHHIHQHGVVYRHLNPTTVGFGTDGTIMLTDLSQCRSSRQPQDDPMQGPLPSATAIFDAQRRSCLFAFAPGNVQRYLAPELVLFPHHTCTPSADIYSWGLLSAEMLTLSPPYAALRAGQHLVHICMQGHVGVGGLRSVFHLPSHLAHLLHASWKHNPKERWEMARIISGMKLYMHGQTLHPSSQRRSRDHSSQAMQDHSLRLEDVFSHELHKLALSGTRAMDHSPERTKQRQTMKRELHSPTTIIGHSSLKPLEKELQSSRDHESFSNRHTLDQAEEEPHTWRKSRARAGGVGDATINTHRRNPELPNCAAPLRPTTSRSKHLHSNYMHRSVPLLEETPVRHSGALEQQRPLPQQLHRSYPEGLFCEALVVTTLPSPRKMRSPHRSSKEKRHIHHHRHHGLCERACVGQIVGANDGDHRRGGRHRTRLGTGDNQECLTAQGESGADVVASRRQGHKATSTLVFDQVATTTTNLGVNSNPEVENDDHNCNNSCGNVVNRYTEGNNGTVLDNSEDTGDSAIPHDGKNHGKRNESRSSNASEYGDYNPQEDFAGSKSQCLGTTSSKGSASRKNRKTTSRTRSTKPEHADSGQGTIGMPSSTDEVWC